MTQNEVMFWSAVLKINIASIANMVQITDMHFEPVRKYFSGGEYNQYTEHLQIKYYPEHLANVVKVFSEAGFREELPLHGGYTDCKLRDCIFRMVDRKEKERALNARNNFKFKVNGKYYGNWSVDKNGEIR